MKKKVLFIDRDGTLIHEPADYQIDTVEKLSFYPGVFTYLGRIVREMNFELVMVTNQDGLGGEGYPEEIFWPIHNLVMKTLEGEGIRFDRVCIDRSFPEEKSPNRKPATGMLTDYFSEEYDLENSYVIGDRLTDMELAKNLGAKGILIGNAGQLAAEELQGSQAELESSIALRTMDWEAIYRHLALPARQTVWERNTRETKIKLSLNLDGTGQSTIDTGLAFFDHMLDQLARHGLIDLDLKVDGDLEVDEHHTIEDTGIALGEAFRSALGNKLGVERYGFLLPMDESEAKVSLDFGGRAQLVWKADFRREYIGQMPTEMFSHFFKSFCDGAQANLNIEVEGENEHHKIESVFKAWAKAIKMSIKRDPDRMILPSTKGTL